MKNSIIIIAFTLLSITAMAQEGALKKADRSRNDLAYAEAVDRYTQLLDRGVDSSRVALGLAESYFALREMESAAFWYANAENLNQDETCRFAHALRSSGNVREAESLNASCSADRFDAAVLNYLKTDQDRFQITKTEFNSEGADFGPCFNGDELIFVSDRTESAAVKHRFKWNNRPFLNLYSLAEDETGTPECLPLSHAVNTNFHEGPGCFTDGGDTFYFTRNQSSTEGDQTRKLEILMATNQDGEWTDIRGFTHNSASYSTGHPSISPNGDYLVFTSDMDGGYGGTDIWFCEKLTDGSWGIPQNAGSTVNTAMNEMFPHLGADGFLYFSSDGHANLGGLDVFECHFNAGKCGKAMNLGTPVNSRGDDFSYTLHEDGRIAYFASNRENEATNDDLYKVKVTGERTWEYQGFVKDEDGHAVPNCLVTILTPQGESLGTANTDASGKFKVTTTTMPDENGVLNFNGGNALASAEKVLSECDQIMYLADAGTITLESIGLVGAGTLRDTEANSALANVKTTLTNLGTGTSQTCTSDDNGKISFDLTTATNYEIVFSKEGYFTRSAYFNTNEVTSGVTDIGSLTGIDLTFEKIEVDKTVRIENINYDYNDYRIRTDAAKELDKVVRLLEDNPSMKIELGSHTDARGSDNYNLKLSQKRAKAAVAYIIEKGISKDRITSRGYGETVLINDCGNGQDCSDEAHEQNRRTEFRVTEF